MDVLRTPFKIVGDAAEATGRFVKDVGGGKDGEREPLWQPSEEDQRKQLALQAEQLRFKREQLAYEEEQRQLKVQQVQMDREAAINDALLMGNSALDRGEYEEAWNQFKKVLSIDSYHPGASRGVKEAQEKLGYKAIEEGDYLKALRAFVKGHIDVEIRSTLIVLLNRAKMEEARVEDQARSHSLPPLEVALKVYEEWNQQLSEIKQMIPRDRLPEELSRRVESLRLKIDQTKDKIRLILMKNQAAVKVKEADEELEFLQKEYDAGREHSIEEILDFQRQLEEIQKSYGVARGLDPDCFVTQEERLLAFFKEVDAILQKSNLTHLIACLKERSLRNSADLEEIINLCKLWEGSYNTVRKSRYITSEFKLKVKPIKAIIQEIGLLANFTKTKLDNLEQDFAKIVNQAIQRENIKGQIPFKKLELLKVEYRSIFDKNEKIRNMFVALNEVGRNSFENFFEEQLAGAAKRVSCLCFSSNRYKFSPTIPFSEKSLYDLLSRIARTNSVEDISYRLGGGDSSSEEDEGRQVEGQYLRAPSTVASAPPLETTQ